MKRKLLIGAVALASAVAGLVTARANDSRVATARVALGCPAVPLIPDGASRALETGRDLFAVAHGQIIAIGAGGAIADRAAGDGATLRHVAAAPGLGTAYVIDRAGGDRVVIATPRGTRVVREPGDATHPTWSPMGDLAWGTGAGVAVLDHRSGRISRIAGPVRGGTVFSPVFASASRLVAVVASPPTPTAPHGARLDNLWVTRVAAPAWHRLTDFHAGDDRWVTVRTPISFDGGVYFVRIEGRASATRQPRFELWRLDGGTARRVRDLPHEQYLAGSRAGHLLWNVPDPLHGRVTLAIEGPDGLRTIGCGSVMVDPIDAVDPDRRAGEGGEHVPPRGDWPALEAPDAQGAEEIAVIVGDYPAVADAEAVAAAIRASYPTSTVEVVDSTMAPLAIRPGVYGAMLHLPDDADPTAALAAFRTRLPAYSATSWIVTP
jgi:hypothetical protein